MSYEIFDVSRPGGALRVGRWGAGQPVVLAAHGLTANHMCFAALADAIGEDITVVAPDLRGRGGSAAITGSFGMADHADDLAAVLDHLGMEDAVVVGHSMGGFASVVMADRHPDRVSGIVLVDGGLPLDLAHLADLPVEELIRAITGPALDRLRVTFPTRQAYVDHWRDHPALRDHWNDYIERLYDYDLVGDEPDLRSSVREDAVLEDSASELRSGDVEHALAHLTQSVVLLRAPRGIFDEVPPLYPDATVAAARRTVTHLEDVLIDDTNHYTILLEPRAAKEVAGAVRARL